MRQTAQIKRVLPGGMAEIAVVRQGACSHNCADCGGCMTAAQPTVTAQAENPLGAQEGDLVVVETANAQLMGVIAFVYLIPMAFLVAGYLLAQAAGLTSGWCILVGLAAFALSMVLILTLDRYLKRHQTLQFKIVSLRVG